MEFCRPVFLLLALVHTTYQIKKLSVCLRDHSSPSDAYRIANASSYTSVTQITNNCYSFEKEELGIRKRETNLDVEEIVLSDSKVDAAEVSIPKIRVKRSRKKKRRGNEGMNKFIDAIKDPEFNLQWHLLNKQHRGKDLNVLPVWRNNITGQGVVVAILDDGVERNHPDIIDNYEESCSWDFLDNDSDPTPVVTDSDQNVNHGTRCAGQVAAARNQYCGLGVAFNARLAGIRMLNTKVEDAVEAKSLEFKRDEIHIYSSSWGPSDDGQKVDGPGILVRDAFKDGIQYGRSGRGSIFIWASGNGGNSMDNCNCDGYCSSIYTISISAVNDRGQVPTYVEECTATLAAAYSSGTGVERRIATTDLYGKCTDQHGGTSAAAPLAAGVVALALSANPELTWRDVQHIIVESSSHHYIEDTVINGAGRRFNNKIGFGVLNSEAAVEKARDWQSVGAQHICRNFKTQEEFVKQDTRIRDGRQLIIQINSLGCMGTPQAVVLLEHVQAVLSINHNNRGSLKIKLVSPSGTRSQLLTERPSDKNANGFNLWSFMTVQMWGEVATGGWLLSIEGQGQGELTHFELILYGTEYSVKKRVCDDDTYAILPTNSTEDVKCVERCPVKRFYTVDKRCIPCHGSCHTCLDYNYCTSCPENMFLNYEEHTCVEACPKGYSIASSRLSGKICEAFVGSDETWYQGDTVYIVIVVVFIVALILMVLIISAHHYKKHLAREARWIEITAKRTETQRL